MPSTAVTSTLLRRKPRQRVRLKVFFKPRISTPRFIERLRSQNSAKHPRGAACPNQSVFTLEFLDSGAGGRSRFLRLAARAEWRWKIRTFRPLGVRLGR